MNTAEGFMRTFPKWPHSLMKGINIELRLCFVTSLSVSCLKHGCIFCISELFVGKVLDLNTNLIPLGKWLRSSLVWRTLLASFFVVCLSNCGLATFHSEVRNHRHQVVFECKSTRIKRES